MTSERQIAANRRNALKGTGPRSGAGKQRASSNAYRHGLAASIRSSEAFANEVDQLARKIAGDTDSGTTLARARAAAEAEFDLVRVRQTKVALIEGFAALRDLVPHQEELSPRAELWRYMKAHGLPVGWLRGPKRKSMKPPHPLPSQEPDRSVEAIQSALPELLKLDRYERRAASRRDRAIRELYNSR